MIVEIGVVTIYILISFTRKERYGLNTRSIEHTVEKKYPAKGY